MSGPLLRPEVRAALARGREALAGVAVMAVAAWLGAASFGVTRLVAVALGLAGLGLVWTGVQRWRFQRGEGGPGVVQVDERRLVYWGPLTGGVVDLDDLARLEIDSDRRPAHWVLTLRQGEALAVPVTARGAEGLLDLFAALPGLRTEAMLAALAREGGGRVTLWQAGNVVRLTRRGEGRRLN
ncbi:hypothetical protein [Rubellimicrobium aerolatum]|uniref:DUF2244 domain-containing protein n=1 Tax=Rubellimicrobium aerolatum TaxID=490979 RepID=A0ABW0SG07_9RHOB|nr:hypothetical protein [Rubellimicrobium aerolatum]MBP1807213.1 hypothetical protein [Rubellimicrobium aerolatum]